MLEQKFDTYISQSSRSLSSQVTRLLVDISLSLSSVLRTIDLVITLAALAEGSLTQTSVQVLSQPFPGQMPKPVVPVRRLRYLPCSL